jgi:hypothetical protein
MKSLQKFINESLENSTLQNVNVKYNVEPSEFVVEVPVSYSEDDITIYMGDKLFNNLPADKQYSKQFFGKNEEHIFDVYFEYDGFGHSENINDEEANLEWDSHYDNSIKSDTELVHCKFTNLKYVISFDKFELLNNEDKDEKTTLNDIFQATVSNNNNEYSLKISLDPENIECD